MRAGVWPETEQAAASRPRGETRRLGQGGSDARQACDGVGATGITLWRGHVPPKRCSDRYIINLFGQIRTLELPNSARFVQTA